MVQRLTYRRRKSYNTCNNKVKKVRTPGGKLTIAYLAKKASVPKCGDTGKPLFGIPAVRPFALKSLAKRKRTVNRAYGGVLSASAVRQRYVTAAAPSPTFVSSPRVPFGQAARAPSRLLPAARSPSPFTRLSRFSPPPPTPPAASSAPS